MRLNKRGLRRLSVCLSLSLLFSVLCLPCEADEAIRSRDCDSGDKRIALTFDDGPHPHQTEHILSVLEHYGVQATFFMIGVNVENYPEAARAVIAAGHEVGNHTFSHIAADRLGAGELLRELEACEDALERLCEYRPHLFRPPKGILNDSLLDIAEHEDCRVVLWSLDTRDWECRDAETIAERVLSSVKPGDIILMHDYVAKSKTPEALEILLPRLLALGYEPVTVSRLLGIG